MGNNHEWEPDVATSRDGKKIEYYVLDCHKTERSCEVHHGHDFDYCPFCGDELK